MSLVYCIAILMAGGVLALLLKQRQAARMVSLIAVVLAAIPVLPLVSQGFGLVPAGPELNLDDSQWLAAISVSWIEPLGVRFLLAADGFSLSLILLTLFLGITAILAAWEEIQDQAGFFYFNLMWTLAGVVGVFTALDLLLFFFFWEVMLIPMFFIISIWGHENKRYAALKFFIYTQASSLLLLISIWVLVIGHYQLTQQWTFSWFELVNGESLPYGLWIMLGFFVAFVVKLPGVPFHNWLPDAHTQAPTPGSVILAGILLKTGAYGLIRFVPSLFPIEAQQFAPMAMGLGVISVLYGAKLAFGQLDIKRMIAYSSISHMGFVLIATFTWNAIALQGAAIQLLAHGLSSAGLFALAGTLQHKLHTRDIRRLGGLWQQTPRMGAVGLFFVLAALGMPGLGNFIGEFLVLLGAFKVAPVVAIFAAAGMILAPVYALHIMQRTFHGEPQVAHPVPPTDFGRREMVMMGTLMVGLLILGLAPFLVLDLTAPTMAWMVASIQ